MSPRKRKQQKQSGGHPQICHCRCVLHVFWKLCSNSTPQHGLASNKVVSAVGEKAEELEVARKELHIMESYVKLNLDHARCCTDLASNQKFLLRFNNLHGFCNAWPQ
eukprot:3116500-Prorocentrum_lima.AAC.1